MNKSDYKLEVKNTTKAAYISGVFTLKGDSIESGEYWGLVSTEIEKDVQAMLLVKDWTNFVPDVPANRVVVDKIELDVNRLLFYREDGYIKCPWAVILHFSVLTAKDLVFGATKGLTPYSSFDNKSRAEPLTADDVRDGDFAVD